MAAQGICPKCGKVFFKKTHTQIFCSACIKEGKSRGVSYHKCHDCGDIFELPLGRHGASHDANLCQNCKNKNKKKYICPKCGQEFYKRTNYQRFCGNCIEEGRAGGWSYHICHECGAVFKSKRRRDGSQSNEKFCEECRHKKWEKQQEYRKERKEEGECIVMKKRRCHDCGIATYNYRCAKCQAAWREKYHVSYAPGTSDSDIYQINLRG